MDLKNRLQSLNGDGVGARAVADSDAGGEHHNIPRVAAGVLNVLQVRSHVARPAGVPNVTHRLNVLGRAVLLPGERHADKRGANRDELVGDLH